MQSKDDPTVVKSTNLPYSKELYCKTLLAFDCACSVTSYEIAASLLDILQIIEKRSVGSESVSDRRHASEALAAARRRIRMNGHQRNITAKLAGRWLADRPAAATGKGECSVRAAMSAKTIILRDRDTSSVDGVLERQKSQALPLPRIQLLAE